MGPDRVKSPQAVLPVNSKVSIQHTRPILSGARATLLMYRVVRASDTKGGHSTSLLLFNVERAVSHV